MQLPDILVAADKLGLPLHPIQGGRQFETPCWDCHNRGQKADTNKHGHLTINPSKQVFRCPRCGYSGNVYTMARDLLGKDRGNEFIKDLSIDIRAIRTAQKRVVVEEKPILDIKTRDTVYSELLRKLVLSPSHREDLVSRGLAEDNISENQYRTCPDRQSTLGIAHLLAKDGYPLDGIPGFFKNPEGKWSFMSMPGFLVPVRDLSSRIQGFQIRVDETYLQYINGKNPNNKLRKYMWMSSVSQDAGCSSGSPVHIANPDGLDLCRTKVGITEGPIKADIAAAYTGIPFIGIAGTGLYNQAAEAVASLRVREPLICYDADKVRNEHVLRNEEALIRALNKQGIKCSSCAWDEALGKGIDDLLVRVAKGQIPLSQNLLESVIKFEKHNCEITVTTNVTVKIRPKIKVN